MIIVPVVRAVFPQIVPVIVKTVCRVGFHLQHFAAAGVHLVLILDAVEDERDLVVAVVEVIVPLDKLQVAAAKLGRQQLLRGFGVDVALRFVGVVPVVRIQCHRAGADAVLFHRRADGRFHLGQEGIVRLGRALLELEHDVFLLPGNRLVKVAAGVDAADQLARHLGAGAAGVAFVTVQHGLAVGVAAAQRQYPAAVVVIHLDFGVHAEQHSAGNGGLCGGRRRRRRSGRGSGRRGGRSLRGRSGLVAAGGQGQRGGQGQGEHRHLLFHLGHLLCFGVCLCW